MSKYSFSVAGTQITLNHISRDSYVDNQGLMWYKKGNRFISEDGGFIFNIPVSQLLDNKDYIQYVKETRFRDENREGFYMERLRVIKGF
jgi:hypothetical protein